MKLMLADDHHLFLEGLKYLLEMNGIEVAGTVKNGEEALLKARMLKPDIILMDIKMPVCSGIDALKLIKAEMPDIKIVMLTTSDEDDDIFDAIKHGASGYLLKNINAKELLDMLSGLQKGEIPISPELASRLLKEFRGRSVYDNNPTQHVFGDKHKGQLTERQLKILEMAARGITYKEMGEALGLTERTVKYHMGRIVELLHMENRAQVIAYAARMGLIRDKGNIE